MAEEQNTDTEQHDNTDASGDETLLTGGESAETEGETSTNEGETLLTGKDETVTGAPDAYTDFELPEGYDLSDEFAEHAKAQNWTQEQAQRELDRDIASNSAVEAHEAKQADELKAIKQGWIDETMADKELGGDNHKEVMAGAKQVLDHFGSKELNAILKQSGLGNHPAMIRLFHNMRSVISEDTFIDGSTSPTGQFKSGQEGVIQRMYPKQAS